MTGNGLAGDALHAGTDLSARLGELEESVGKLEKKVSSGPSPWIDLFAKLLIPVLLFYLAFAFKDSVQQALAHRRLEVESAGSIEKLLATLHGEGVQSEQAIASALTLSAYGEAAILPLVATLEYGYSESAVAAQQALFVIGLSHPEAVGTKLGTVLSKREGQFKWQTHQLVIETLGKVGGKSAKEALLSYTSQLEDPANTGFDAWSKRVRRASRGDYVDTQSSLRTALSQVGVEWNASSRGGAP